LKLCPDARFKDEAGFTLIETLIALAILALMLASVGGAIATAVKGTRTIDQRVAIAAASDTLLAEFVAQRSLVPGRQSGEIAGSRWQADISPAEGTVAGTGRWARLLITLRMQGQNGQSVRFSTIRLVPGAPP
jgi:general secretion pathway protein I